MENITFTDQLDAIDFPKVTQMLSQAYWSPGISMVEIQQGARNSSLVVGAFLPDKTQIGYARVISDKTRFAYILDLYIDEPYRKQGIGQALMKYILAHESHKDVYQWLLITKDAHGVYHKLGFQQLSRPLDWMEIRKDRPKR
ncbi:MAG: GNAT family N-acetyltransferase [Deltaproteobacteria bacterium]|nr:GNAT family N-acetyltransferase [Deltaproteobacteria bacterium]